MKGVQLSSMETHETYNKKFDLLVKKHKHLCPLLWFHTANQTANDKRFCCVAKPIHKMNGEKYDENRKLSMTDHWNSAEHHHARKQNLKNSKEAQLPECWTCWKQEENNIASYRDEAIEGFPYEDITTKKVIIENITKTINGDIEEFHNPTSFDIKFGNLCNLKCPTCSPHSSSQLHKEVTQNNMYMGNTEDDDVFSNFYKDWNQSDADWTEDKTWWEDFNSITSHVRKYKSTGGEPILNQYLIEHLKKLIENKRSKDILLRLVTNGQTLTKDFVDKILRNFKEVALSVSLDAVGKQYEYIRYPGKWKVATSHAKKVIHDNPNDIKAKLTRIYYRIHPTLSILNILSLGKLFKWSLEMNKQQNPFNKTNWNGDEAIKTFGNENYLIVNPGFVFFPQHLSIIHLLTEDMKKQVIQYWLTIKSTIPNWKGTVAAKQRYIEYCDDIITRVKASKVNKDEVRRFVKYINGIDKIRKTSFKDSCPDEYELFREYFE